MQPGGHWSKVLHPAAFCRHAPLIAPRTLIRRSRPLHPASDEALVTALRGGDDTAFERIYDRHHLGLLGFCRHMLGSQPEAEDALQLVLLSAYDALRRDDRTIALKPWLYTIARNRCTSVLRARREERPLDDEQQLSTTGLALAEEVEQREELRAMLGDVAGLPDEQRAALVMAELADLTHEEIGMSLGVPTAKVKALVFQARTSLVGSRRARDTPCVQIREQLATLRGSALRRGEITRHLEGCAGCVAFREEIRLQRVSLGCVLPVAPALALKQQLLTGLLAAGTSGAAGAGGVAGATASSSGALAGTGSVAAGATAGSTAATGAAGGTGMLAAAGSSLGAAKVLIAVVVAGGVAGGTVAGERAVRGPSETPAEKRSLAPAHPLVTTAPAASVAPGRTSAGPGRSVSAPRTTARGAMKGGEAAARRKAATRRALRETTRKARATREKAKAGSGLGKAGPAVPTRGGGVRNARPERPGGPAAGSSKRASSAKAASPKQASVMAPGRDKAATRPQAAGATQGSDSTAGANAGRSGRAAVAPARTPSPKERKRARSAP